jgi:L-lactate dehydrogenase complex protein LldG
MTDWAGSPGEAVTRERVLARVRAAIGGGRRPAGEVDAEYTALPRGYLRAHHDPASHDIVTLFAERAADYRAVVERVTTAALPETITRVIATWAGDPGHAEDGGPHSPPRRSKPGSTPSGGGRNPDRPPWGSGGGGGGRGREGEAWFVVPAGLPPGWLAGVTGVDPAVRLVGDEPPLSATQLDSCAGVITGCAVAIAETGTIVLDHSDGQGRRALTLVPDFHLVIVRHDQIAADLPDALARLDPSRPLTLIAGPSATSDIELIRVEGVHGPRTLHVLITEPG